MSHLNNLLDEIDSRLKMRPATQIYNSYNINYNQYQNNNRNNIIRQNESRNIIKNEMYPYNNNFNNEVQSRINQLHNEIENLKTNEYNINKIREEMTDINNKLFKIEVDTSSLAKNIKNNETLYKENLNEEQNNNEKIINKYNEIEDKYNELNNQLNIIKAEQNKAGIEIMNSVINNNNYEEELIKVESNLNNFLNEQNNKFDNTLSIIYNNYLENTTNKEKEINFIKSDVNKTEEKFNNVKIHLSPINEIPIIQNGIGEMDGKMKEILVKYEQILKEQEDMNLKNNVLRQSLLNTNKDLNDLNNQIEQNQNNLEELKNDFIIKSELKEINLKIENINNEINSLKEISEKNKNMLNNATKEIKDINKNKDALILKEEYEKEVNKKQNEFDELKTNSLNKVNEYDNNYNNILNKFNQFNEEEINSMININKQFKDISDKVNINNNEIKKLETENNNIYNNFIQIKDKFKLIDKNIFNLKSLENNTINNKNDIESLINKIDKLEKDLILNKDKKSLNDDLQLENLESFDKFNNKLNNENEIREDKYQELIKETRNNENMIENQINEISKKQDYNMNEIFDKLNEFKKQQIIINEKNKIEIDQLNKGISEQIKEFENIKKSIKKENENNNKKMLEKRLDDLENEINGWLEFSKKIDELIEQNMKENNLKLEEINLQMNKFRQNVSDNLKETKTYIDKTIEAFIVN